MGSDSELVPVHMVAYEDDSDLEINYGEEPTVENHEELVNAGQTYGEVRALTRDSAEEHHFDIVEPGDPLWDERLADLERGDCWRVEELN